MLPINSDFKTVKIGTQEADSLFNFNHKDYFWVPIHSLNGNKKWITFVKIFKNKKFNLFEMIKYLLQTMRIRWWLIMWTPMLFLLGYWSLQELRIDSLALVATFVAAALGFSIFTMISDLRDYFLGWDQIKPQTHTVLTQGLLNVKQYKNTIYFLGSLFLFFVVLLIPMFNEIFLLLVFIGLLSIILWIFVGLKYRPFGEWVLFIVFGPLMSSAYSILMISRVGLMEIFLGFIFGVLAVLMHQCERFPYLMIESRQRLPSTFVQLGFERAKKYLVGLFIALSLITILFQIIYHLFWGIVYGILSIIGTWLLWRQSRKVQSPLGYFTKKFLRLLENITFIFLYFWIYQSTLYIFLAIFWRPL